MNFRSAILFALISAVVGALAPEVALRLEPAAAVGVTSGCSKVNAPSPVVLEAGVEGVNGLCTMLVGITENETLISICATAEEIVQIAAFLVPFLEAAPDAGGRICTPLPNTVICATKEELGRALSMVVARRRVMFLADAGAAQ